MKARRLTKGLVLLVAAQLAVACSKEPRVLEVERPTELLERPYPLGYPSSEPEPNAVLKVLSPRQRVVILSDSYEKDFHVYKVRDSDGNEGYLIGRRPGVRELPASEPQ